jgi:hypothetical protein
MATAEVMRRYRQKHREKTLQYNREYMRTFMAEKRLKYKDYETCSRNLRKIYINYFY